MTEQIVSEFRVTYINPRAGGNQREAHFVSEGEARAEARELVAMGCWDVRLWKRPVSDWQVFAQTEFPGEPEKRR